MSLPPHRSQHSATEAIWTLGWHVAGAVAVTLAAHAISARTPPVWALGPDGIAGAVGIAMAFVLAALVGQLVWTERTVRRIVLIAIGTVLSFAVAWFVLTRWGITVSRRVFLGATLITCALLIVPVVLPRFRAFALGGVTVAALALGVRDWRRVPEPTPPVVHAMHYSFNFTRMVGLLPRPTARMYNGGALTPYKDGFLVVTDGGEFYRLTWGPVGDSLRAARLDLRSPFNRNEFVADQPNSPMTFRITDMLIADRGGQSTLLLAHQYWDRERRCFSLRVSSTVLEGAPAGPRPPWETLFESQPCLTLDGHLHKLRNHEVGGVMALHPRGLLLTLGNNHFDGLSGEKPFAQDTSVNYGKILLVEWSGKSKTWSIGHRNPIGLLVDREGRVWSTENGPRHGDELNLIVEGGNYGWPMVTYGVQYGLDVWPLSPESMNHGDYRGPATAFVPAPGLARLVEVRSDSLKRWRGDLLIASLIGTSLFRVRLHGNQVVYTESIPVGARIRDIEESPDGRLVMFTDSGEILVAARGTERLGTDERLYQVMCAGCHEPPSPAVARSAPNLKGVIGRPVASTDFQYSAAMRALGGTWTAERLDSLLADPTTIAPATTMSLLGPIDAGARRAVISYLSTYREGAQR